MELIWTQDEIFDFLDEQKRLMELEYWKYVLYQRKRERFRLRGYEGVRALREAELEFKEHLAHLEQLLEGRDRLLLAIDKQELRDVLLGMLLVREIREVESLYPEKPSPSGTPPEESLFSPEGSSTD